MKRKLLLLLIVFMSLSVSHAQKRKEDAGVAPISVNYALPKVSFRVVVEMICERQTPGIYASYAQNSLGVNKVITNNSEQWELKDVNVTPFSVVDEKCVYTIGTQQDYHSVLLSLTGQGCLAGIGASGLVGHEDQLESHIATEVAYLNQNRQTVLEDILGYNMKKEVLDSNWTMQEFDGEMRRIWDPIVRYEAKSEQEHVKALVDEIIRIRSERKRLLVSDVDLSDGESLEVLIDEFNAKEKLLLSFFVGKRERFTVKKEFVVTPSSANKTQLAFNFSPEKGAFVDKSGEGEAFLLQVVRSTTPAGKSDAAVAGNGIFYRVPATAEVALVTDGRVINSFTTIIPQLGVLKVIPFEAIRDGLRVKIHPQYGSILSIERGAPMTTER